VKLTSPLSSAEVKNRIRLHGIVLIYLSTGIISLKCYRSLRFKALQLHSVKHIAIPVTGGGGPQGCETSRHPHFADSTLIDGGEVVSLTPRPPCTPKKIPGTHFC
jgi:hypothetical protein